MPTNTKRTRKKNNINNPIRQEYTEYTLSALCSELRKMVKGETPDEEFDQSREGIILDILIRQTDALNRIVYSSREWITECLPTILAILSAEGITKAIKKSTTLPPELKNSGFDVDYLQRLATRRARSEANQKTDIPPDLKEEINEIEKANREFKKELEKRG